MAARRKTREQNRSRLLADLDADIEAAKAGPRPSWGAVASMQALRARVLGLADVPPAEPGTIRPKSSGDPLRDLHADVHRLRLEASARGSMVAASHLLRQEQEVLAQLRARDEEEAARQRAHLSGEVLAADLIEAIRSLPDDVIEQIREAIGA